MKEEKANTFWSVQTDQAQDVFLRQELAPGLMLRLLYLRCQEARVRDLPGQDYTCLVYNAGVNALYFCVCDGVGSSYAGDFAASYLARHIVDWLPTLSPEIFYAPEQLSEFLPALLNTWAQRAQDALRKHQYARKDSPLVREVLSELRDTYGSETVFFAGRFDMPADPSEPILALFCWMGNVSAHMLSSSGERMVVCDASDDSSRWSTGRGTHGHIMLQTMELYDLQRMLVFTDGMLPLQADLTTHSDEELQQCALETLEQPQNDDMALLDLNWS